MSAQWWRIEGGETRSALILVVDGRVAVEVHSAHDPLLPMVYYGTFVGMLWKDARVTLGEHGRTSTMVSA